MARRHTLLLLLALGACDGTPTASTRGTPPALPADPTATNACAQPFGDPSTSLYVLPYPVGREYQLNQSACPSNLGYSHYGSIAYDFGLAMGDSVVASRAGIVLVMEERWPDGDRDCGHANTVIVRHSDSTVLMYTHLQQEGVQVEVGDSVAQGQFIARSGDSGCSSGPHLHVQLYQPVPFGGSGLTLPLNYRNAAGPTTMNRLVGGAAYRAVGAPR